MTFLPIVDRELRVRARLKSTYRFRLGAAVLAIVIVSGLMVMSETFVTPSGFGPGVFKVLACLTFLHCLLEGTRNTADCLSEEKRAGTLGLLFLTDLKGYDVVLGKLMATSLNSFYSLLAVFPPLAIPIILGGVTAGEFWRLVLVLMNALFFSLSAGLCVSAVSRLERKAWGGTLGIIGFFAVVPPLFGLVATHAPSVPFLANLQVLISLSETSALASPTTCFLNIFDASYNSAPSQYWLSLAAVHLLGWCFLTAASYLLPRAWQDAPVRQKHSWLRPLQARWYQRDGASHHRERRHLLNLNPIVWLAGRREEQRFYLWVLVSLTGGTALIAWLATGGLAPVAVTIFLCDLVLHFVLAVWVASEACHLFADARDSGALELLLSTPIKVKDIVEGHFLALKRLFFWPVLALLVAETAMLVGQAVVMSLNDGDVPGALFVMIGVGLCLVIAIMDLYAVAFYGMWMGLSSRKPGQALTKTVLFVLVLPLVAGVCCGVLWPIGGVMKNLIFINYGQDQLRRQFRAIVTERFESSAEGTLQPAAPPKKLTPHLPPVLPR